MAFHHKWVRGTHGGHREIGNLHFFVSTCPRINGKLKLLHRFGFNQMIIKMILVSVG